jgi:adhesin HecA-like repeat protein
MSGGMSTATMVGIGMTIASTAVTALASAQQGRAQQVAMNYQAAQEDQNANNATASGQRAMIEANKKTALVESNAVAAGAGSGGTSTDPTVSADLDLIGAEGNYRAQTALYDGNAKAQALRNQASADVFQGNIDNQAGQIKAGTSMLAGATSLFNKYGTSFNSDDPSFADSMGGNMAIAALQ